MTNKRMKRTPGFDIAIKIFTRDLLAILNDSLHNLVANLVGNIFTTSYNYNFAID